VEADHRLGHDPDPEQDVITVRDLLLDDDHTPARRSVGVVTRVGAAGQHGIGVADGRERLGERSRQVALGDPQQDLATLRRDPRVAGAGA